MIEIFNRREWLKEIHKLQREIRALKRRLKITSSAYGIIQKQLSLKSNKIDKAIQKIKAGKDPAKSKKKKLVSLNKTKQLIKKLKQKFFSLINRLFLR